jgi:hypothetical protein
MGVCVCVCVCANGRERERERERGRERERERESRGGKGERVGYVCAWQNQHVDDERRREGTKKRENS